MNASHRAAVAVVGLGAMGAAVLHQLAKRGVDAVGIDRYAPPHAFGSSHGETRITRCAVGEGEDYAPLALASHRIWRELEALTGETLLEACGCLIMASQGRAALHHGKADFVGRSAASARAFNIPHEILAGEEVMRRFPGIAGAEGAQAFFEPGGGYVHPERCIAAQLNQARQGGARILQGAVHGVVQADRVVRIETDEGVVEAERAVVAAGAWTGALLGAPFDRLLTVSRQVLHWYPADGAAYAPERFPTVIWMHGDGNEDYFYAFPAVPGTGLVKAATEQYRRATTPETAQRAVDPAESEAMHREHLAGRLLGVEPRAAKAAACLYTVTPDSGFIVDRHPRMERVTVISACSGHGFKHSAGLGEAVATSLAEGRPSAALAPFGLARFAAEAAP